MVITHEFEEAKSKWQKLDELVSGVNCAMTRVYAGLDIANAKLGEYVVIQGAGGLGLYAHRTRHAGQPGALTEGRRESVAV